MNNEAVLKMQRRVSGGLWRHFAGNLADLVIPQWRGGGEEEEREPRFPKIFLLFNVKVIILASG